MDNLTQAQAAQTVPPLTDEQLAIAYKDLVIKYPRIERMPVDPPAAGQNIAAFSFKLLPKPVNGIYGILKWRGGFRSMAEFEDHAKYIIRCVDSKHKIYPYEYGRWFPITTNDSFASEELEVGERDEIVNIFNKKETEENKEQARKVREIKSRERKLIEECQRKEFDKSTLDYYAQQVMKIQQLTTWLEQMRQRKRDMLKALRSGKEEMERIQTEHPEYVDQVDERIRQIKEEIGLDADTPIDRPSFMPSKNN